MDDGAMTEAGGPGRRRRRLREVELTGLRRDLRRGLLAILGLAALASAMGFALGLERARSTWSEIGPWGPWHSFAVEAFGAPVAAPALVAAAAWWARRGGFPRGALVIAAVIAEAVALLAFAVEAHLFEEVEHTLPQDLAVFAQIVVVAGAAALLVIEPLAFVLERRRLEDGDPVVATARVVTRGRAAR